MRIITIACWLVAAAAVIGLAIWFLTGTIFGFRSDRWELGKWRTGWLSGISIGGFGALSGPYEPAGTYNVEISGINAIDIDWVSGNITVKPYDGSEISFTESARRALNDDERLQYNTSGGTLSIKFTEHSLIGFMPQKRLEVLVPGGLSMSLDNLKVNSTSGGIYTDGISAATYKVDSTSGSIEICNSVSQTLFAHSTSGSVTIAAVRTNDIDLNSTSGSISVSDTSASVIDCDTTSGSIRIGGAFDSVNAKSASGRIALDNSAPGSALKTKTISGAHEVSGDFSSADLGSTSGSLTIKSTSIPLKLKADTTSGSINVYIPAEGSVTVRHSSISGSFNSDIPVVMTDSSAQFNLSSTSGSVRIRELS